METKYICENVKNKYNIIFNKLTYTLNLYIRKQSSTEVLGIFNKKILTSLKDVEIKECKKRKRPFSPDFIKKNIINKEKSSITIIFDSYCPYEVVKYNIQSILNENKFDKINISLNFMETTPKITTNFNCIIKEIIREEFKKFCFNFIKNVEEKLKIKNLNKELYTMVYDVNKNKLIIYFTLDLYKKFIEYKKLNNRNYYENVLYRLEIDNIIYNFTEYMIICGRCKRYHNIFNQKTIVEKNCAFMCQFCDNKNIHNCENKSKIINCNFCKIYLRERKFNHDINKKFCFYNNTIFKNFIIENRNLFLDNDEKNILKITKLYNYDEDKEKNKKKNNKKNNLKNEMSESENSDNSNISNSEFDFKNNNSNNLSKTSEEEFDKNKKKEIKTDFDDSDEECYRNYKETTNLKKKYLNKKIEYKKNEETSEDEKIEYKKNEESSEDEKIEYKKNEESSEDEMNEMFFTKNVKLENLIGK